MAMMSPVDAAFVSEALEVVDSGGAIVNMRDGHSEFWGADELSKRLESTDHNIEWVFLDTKMEKHENLAEGTLTVNLMKDGGAREGWDACMVSKLKNVNGLRVSQKVDGCHVRFGLTSDPDDDADYKKGFFLGIYPDKKVMRREKGKMEITAGKYELNEQFTTRILRGSVTALRNDEQEPFDVIGKCEEEGTSMYGKIWIHEKDALAILEGVFAIAMVSSIDINGNLLTDNGVDRLCQGLEVSWTKVTHLDLGLNRIRCVGASRIAQALEKSTSRITSLVLSNNEICDEGSARLAEALAKEGCRVTKLWLNDNQIADDGAIKLAEMLEKETCQLTLLELSWNKIEDDGMQRLIQAISKPECKITEFALDHNKCTDKKTRKMLTMIMAKLPRLVDMT